jgi:hypothetical protein
MTNPQYAWLDGLVVWDDANCHVSSLAFKYGAAVFEGIRAYWDGTHLNIWQLDEHLARLEHGQRFMRFTSPFSAGEMRGRSNSYCSRMRFKTTCISPSRPFCPAPDSLFCVTLVPFLLPPWRVVTTALMALMFRSQAGGEVPTVRNHSGSNPMGTISMVDWLRCKQSKMAMIRR